MSSPLPGPAYGLGTSAATPQLRALLRAYARVLPRWTFPYVPFAVAAVAQVFAWFGGRFLGGLTLGPRVLLLWLFALGEYGVMSPAMNAATELLGHSEPRLVVWYHAITLAVFMVINVLVFRNPFRWRHVLAFALLAAAVYVAHLGAD